MRSKIKNKKLNIKNNVKHHGLAPMASAQQDETSRSHPHIHPRAHARGLLRRRVTFRIIDVNTNRAVEGLRVMEEVARFVVEHKTVTRQLKNIRQQLRRNLKKLLVSGVWLKHRNTSGDVGRRLYTERESRRRSIADIFAANAKRVEEALRVLEEFSKLIQAQAGRTYKAMRFKVYALEKKIASLITAN